MGGPRDVLPVPIAHGVHAYAEQAELLLFAYAIGNGPVQVWDCTATATMPEELSAALHQPRGAAVLPQLPF